MGYSDPPSLNILTQDILFEKLPKKRSGRSRTSEDGEVQAVSEPPGLPCGENDAETDDSLPRLSVGGGETSHRHIPRGGEGRKES
jgi:hypothetical protein